MAITTHICIFKYDGTCVGFPLSLYVDTICHMIVEYRFILNTYIEKFGHANGNEMGKSRMRMKELSKIFLESKWSQSAMERDLKHVRSRNIMFLVENIISGYVTATSQNFAYGYESRTKSFAFLIINYSSTKTYSLRQTAYKFLRHWKQWFYMKRK